MRDFSSILAKHTTSAERCRVESAAHLSVEGASWSEPKSKRTILKPISFDLAPGGVLGVVGPNGAGKSTLLRLLYRYHAPTIGFVKVDGVDIWSVPAHKAAQTVGAGARDTAIVQDALDQLGLAHFASRQLGTLSGGERQRVMVARALAQEPRLLILDEPTNHLDMRHQLEVLALIRELPLTIVTSLHDLNMATAVCDQVLMLQGGAPLRFGTPQTVLTESAVSQVFQVTARQERLAPSDTKHLTFHL